MEKKPQKETILKLAETSPEIKMTLDFYNKGELTWEETLMGCIILLEDELERHRARDRRKYYQSR